MINSHIYFFPYQVILREAQLCFLSYKPSLSS